MTERVSEGRKKRGNNQCVPDTGYQLPAWGRNKQHHRQHQQPVVTVTLCTSVDVKFTAIVERTKA